MEGQFACPLMIVSVDAAGKDLMSAPAAYVQVSTRIHPVRCAIQDVRILSYA